MTKEWLNMSDADSEDDDDKWDELYEKRVREWKARFGKKGRRRFLGSGTRRMVRQESPPHISTDVAASPGPAINAPTTKADSEERSGDTVQEQLRTMSEEIRAMQKTLQSRKKPRTGKP